MVFYRWGGIFLLILTTSINLGASEAQWGPWRTLLEQARFPENDETRQALAASIAAPAYPAVEAEFETLYQLSDGRTVRFELRRGADSWYLIFRNQRGTPPYDTFPLWGRGTWIIKKSLFTGEFIQAKVFLQDDQETFARLFPAGGGRTRMDLFLYGRSLGAEVMLGIPFEELLTSPFARVLHLSSAYVDWSLLFPSSQRVEHQRARDLVLESSGYHFQIQEVADAALDKRGRNVFIEDLSPLGPGDKEAGYAGMNCSGYTKWIADGLYSAWLGTPGTQFLEIDPLKTPTVERDKNPWNDAATAKTPLMREELRNHGWLRDPWFGLNWSRNLARSVEEARRGRPLLREEAMDLDAVQVPWLHYREDRGYRLEELSSLLYFLAAQYPGNVWFASISSRFVPPEAPGAAPLQQHWHAAVLVPWFEPTGHFRAAALDTGLRREVLPLSGTVSLPDLTAKLTRLAVEYASLGRDDEGEPLSPDIYIHLSRARIPDNFAAVPPALLTVSGN